MRRIGVIAIAIMLHNVPTVRLRCSKRGLACADTVTAM